MANSFGSRATRYELRNETLWIVNAGMTTQDHRVFLRRSVAIPNIPELSKSMLPGSGTDAAGAEL
jgi:hypothetical protein